MTFSVTTLSIMALHSVVILSAFMLYVTNKPKMLSIIMLLNFNMLSVNMLSIVIMLSVIILNLKCAKTAAPLPLKILF